MARQPRSFYVTRTLAEAVNSIKERLDSIERDGVGGGGMAAVITEPGDPTPNPANYNDGDIWIEVTA